MQVEVVIVGGGIVGLQVAWHLREAGIRRIAVLERGGAGSGATAHGAGFLSHFAWNELDARLVRRSAELYAELARETGGEFFRVTGSYVIAGAGGDGAGSDPGTTTGEPARSPEAERAAGAEEPPERVVALLEARAAMLRRLGIQVQDLTPEEGAAALPAWNWEDVRRAWFLPADATLLPAEAARQLARLLRQRDVAVLEETPAEALALSGNGGAVAGVRSAAGPVAADVVVVATGVWTRRLLQTAGLDAPIKAYRTQLSFWELPEGLGEAALPPLHDVTGEFYWLPREGFLALGDGTQLVEQDPERFRREPDPEFIASARRRLVHRCPAARDARYARGWAHLCDATPDRRPLLGPYGSVAGLHLAVGFNGFGVMRAPAVGELVARFVLGEEPALGGDPVPGVEAVSASRFSGFVEFDMAQGFNTAGGDGS